MITSFSTLLHDIRTTRQLSRTELAQLIGFDRKTVWNWEQGRNHPSISTQEKIAICLSLPKDYFYRFSAEAEIQQLRLRMARLEGEVKALRETLLDDTKKAPPESDA